MLCTAPAWKHNNYEQLFCFESSLISNVETANTEKINRIAIIITERNVSILFQNGDGHKGDSCSYEGYATDLLSMQ